MSAVAVLPVDQVIDRLGHIELQQKRLGQVNHAMGIRLAITAILADGAATAWLVEPPPAPAVPFAHMVTVLTGSTVPP